MEWHGYDAILLGSTVYSAASVKKPVVQPSSFAAVRFMQVEPQKGAGTAVQSGTGKTEEGKEERRNGTVSKVKFNADEMMVMAMFEQPTRTETMRYIEEVVPFVEDDVEVFSLVASTMKKMRSISDMEFSRLDLKPYLQDVVAK